MLERLQLGGPPRKVAVVTGGSRGLGKAMALALAGAGAEVCIASRTESQLAEAADEIESATGRRPLYLTTNVQKRAECDALIQRTVEQFGRVDILVNNAGIGDSRGAGANFLDISDDDWLDTIEVNLHSTFYCSRAGIRHMVGRRGGGVVLNIASGNGRRASPHLFGYGAAKAGVISLTQSLAAAYVGEGIRVNCIIPGYILQRPPETDAQRAAAGERGRFIAAGRVGEAWELGPLAVYLCSDAASYVTGESFVIDGGGLAGGVAPVGFSMVPSNG